MTVRNAATRRSLSRLATAGALGSAIMLIVTFGSLHSASAAASFAGNAQIVDPNSNQPLASGGSATNFTLKLTSGAACTGDSAHGQYKIQSYMVPTSVDPGSLQFGSQGPLDPATNSSHAGPNFHEALFDATSNAYVNAQTADATQAGGPGPIINIPPFNFEVYSPSGASSIPPGTYYLGIACTLGSPSATQLDKYWVAQMTITADPTDSGPAHVKWTAVTPTYTPPTTTASTTTTTTAPGGGNQSTTTTTTPSGGSQTTTTTTALAGSSSAAGGTGGSTAADPSAVGGSSASSGASVGSPAGSSADASAGSGGGSLPNTGARVAWLVVWAGFLALFGRMAILLSRPIRVRRDRS